MRNIPYTFTKHGNRRWGRRAINIPKWRCWFTVSMPKEYLEEKQVGRNTHTDYRRIIGTSIILVISRPVVVTVLRTDEYT